MLIKLNPTVYEYLKVNLAVENPDLFKYLSFPDNSNSTLEIDEDIAIDVREWAGEKLQKVGFDIDDDITQEGKVLEEIVDLFYS